MAAVKRRMWALLVALCPPERGARFLERHERGWCVRPQFGEDDAALAEAKAAMNKGEFRSKLFMPGGVPGAPPLYVLVTFDVAGGEFHCHPGVETEDELHAHMWKDVATYCRLEEHPARPELDYFDMRVWPPKVKHASLLRKAHLLSALKAFNLDKDGAPKLYHIAKRILIHND